MTKKERIRRRKLRKRIKKFFLAIKIIIIAVAVLIVAGLATSLLMPNAKEKLAKAFLGFPPGKAVVGKMFKDDYEGNILDKQYENGSIKQNTGLKIGDNYTNIVMFGGDSREGDLGNLTHSDSIIIMSINEETGDVKMSSVFRDTAMKYVVNDKVHYNKATNAMYAGGIESTVNMLNENLDLNISDYVIVNFAGLANIVDALGGFEINISEDERFYINGYLTETRKVTGMSAPDLEIAGNVKLTGLQTTAYCRIRAVPTTLADGSILSDDYGRAARQRVVLEQLMKKAKSAGLGQLMNVAKTLLGQNSQEDKFISSSMSFDEILELLPVALDMNITGSGGFPTNYTTDYIGSADCIIAKDLSSNVSELHNYLFNNPNYTPTENVKSINKKIINLTGVRR